MSRQTRKMNIALFTAAVLLFLTLFTTHLTGGLYARYTTFAESSDGARVAKYVFNVNADSKTAEQELTISLDEILEPGDTDSCTLIISNNDGTDICEVAQQYKVYVTERGSLPLMYSIESSDAESSDSGSSGTNISAVTAALNGTTEKEVLSGTLAAGTADSDTMTINISWPQENNKTLGYAGGVAGLHIRIVAEQLN